jgi:hypothetical protein
LTWGPSLEYLQGLKEDGMDPPALKTKPTLDARLVYFQKAFLRLSPSRRRRSQGHPQPLSLREYLDYFEMFYVRSTTERAYHLKMLQALDEVYVRVMCEKVDAELEAQHRRNSAR